MTHDTIDKLRILAYVGVWAMVVFTATKSCQDDRECMQVCGERGVAECNPPAVRCAQ